MAIPLPLIGNANVSQVSEFNHTDELGQFSCGIVLNACVHGQDNNLFLNLTVIASFKIA